MTAEDRQLLKEIRNQNSMILAQLSRLENQAGPVLGEGHGELPVNVSEMMRADDPVQYLRDRNKQIKLNGRLRKRK